MGVRLRKLWDRLSVTRVAGKAQGWMGLCLLLALLAAFPPIAGQFTQGNLWIRIVAYAALYVLLGLGLNVVVGFAGLLDLGYVAFYAIGAYTYALLASPHFDLHLPFWVILPIAVLLAALAGLLLGIPVLHLRGDYLAIVTLGFGEIIRILVLNLRDFTAGSQGVFPLDKPQLANLEFSSGVHFYYILLVVCVLIVWITGRLNRSRVGRAWAAMREDEDVAAMMGIHTTRYKLLAFAIGAGIGGIGGVIFAAWQGAIFPDNFNLQVSVNVLSLIVIGGSGSIPGVVVGAFALIALPDILRGFQDYRLLLFGLLLVLMMIFRPEGFIPSQRRKMELREGDRR